ncbi:MAG: excinuclease ABC subunit UvrC [Chlamydiota bacterium]|nr:excinuclease ABC subunit UvrC [Chlamydiota bacterium]
MLFDVNKLKLLPQKTGVYIMKSRKGIVLYVGKAKNLRQRVRQYFSEGRDNREMIPLLVSQVADIETIIVGSEKEAFLLENTLIKKYKPKYNVLLKDDKTYIALKINHKHKWPMLQIARYRGQPKPGALYFGPYTSAGAARMTLDLLNRIFPLRQCSDQELKRRSRPCILHGMKRCIAPCVNLCSKEEYDDHVSRTIKFLKGKDKEVLKELYAAMQKYSDALEFERAHDIYMTIKQIEKTIEKQHVDNPLGIDTDAFGLYRQADEVTVSQLIFRGGKLVGSRNFQFNNVAQDNEDVLSSFVLQHYEKRGELPCEVLLPEKCGSKQQIEEILSEDRPRKLRILVPVRGEKVAMVKLANENAKGAFDQGKDKQAIRERTLMEMQEKFKLTKYPRRIECFDNSNISGEEPVSSMVVFSDGEKDSKRYRKYKIKAGAGVPDDYAAMYEVLSRRYKRAKEENDLPDLIVVDGGKGQLNVALRVLEELNIITVNVIGVAKEQGRHDRGLTSEQVFLPNVKDPIILRKNSQVLFLLQQIRDEAHRVAITFHRKRRQKKVLKSVLDDIPGIGPNKKKALLKHFGSIKNIKKASLEELEQAPGISKGNAATIKQLLV